MRDLVRPSTAALAALLLLTVSCDRHAGKAADPAAPQYSPPGGVIDYYLGTVPGTGVRVDIADSAGKPVAAFSSEGSVALSASDVVVAASGYPGA